MPFNHNSLFAGTLESTNAAEGYIYDVSIDQSYALKFHAGNSQSNGESNNQQNLASIFFVASLSANVNNKAGNTGSFVFTHGITTSHGAYDVAEDYPTRDDLVEPGDLVSIDPNERTFVNRSSGKDDKGVVGIYSENPALRLSQIGSTIDGAKAIPVALAGRVPVKVTTENGEIKPGDYLIPSSIPGVAMKAEKAGAVIGQAMGGYDGEGVGRVVVYIKSSSYLGDAFVSLFEEDQSVQLSSDDILAKILANKDKFKGDSEITTDRLIEVNKYNNERRRISQEA